MDAEQPPSYDAVSSSSAAGEPPAYQPTATPHHNVQPQATTEEFPTLVLDGCRVYSRLNQARILYEVTNPPCEAASSIYGVEKIRYKVSESNGEMKVRYRRDHIYDFKSDYFSFGMRDISIIGKSSSKKDVSMTRRLSSSSFSVAGHFKTEQSVKNRVQHGSDISWKSPDGKTLAVENKVEWSKDGRVLEPPRLEIKTRLSENEMDLLVTCWCARVWKQAKDVADPVTWKQSE